jgi:cathepsin L
MSSSESITRRVFMQCLAAMGAQLAPSPLRKAWATTGTPGAFPIHWRGARIPPNLELHVRAQNAAAAEVTKVIKSDPGVFKALTTAHPNYFADTPPPAKYDWRSLKRVTPIKDQGNCGSCWAFAAIGAYESAYLIANKRDAVDQYGYAAVDVSEQEALDCGLPENDCVLGGWHEVVFMYLQLEGEVSGFTYPYHIVKGFCTSKLPSRPYYVLNWGYVADGSTPGNTVMPADIALKRAILRYGPVSSSVVTKGWGNYSKLSPDGTPNPKWQIEYPNGIFRGVPTQQCKVDDIDHEVVIVGWDDTLKAWFIRNSWGTGWGDEGYMKLAYQSNYIGYGSSWVIAAPEGSVSPNLTQHIRGINQKNALRQFYDLDKLQ